MIGRDAVHRERARAAILAPRPMTPEQVADLIRRVRATDPSGARTTLGSRARARWDRWRADRDAAAHEHQPAAATGPAAEATT